MSEQDREAGNVWIWPEHVEAFEVFADCETQWRVIAGPASVFQQGLDYTAVHAVMQMRSVEDQSACLARIRLIERGALDQLNK